MSKNKIITGFFLFAIALGLIGFRHNLPMLDAIEGQVVAGSFRFFVGPDLQTPCCITYPPGFFYLIALLTGIYYLIGSLAGFFLDFYDFYAQMLIDPTPLTLIARTVSLLSFSLLVVLLFLLGEQMFGRRAGVLAGLLALATPSLVAFAKLGQMEMLMLLLGTASIWFAYKVVKKGKPSDIIASGLLAAASTSMKYNGAVFILPAFVAILFLKKRRIHFAIWFTLAFGITGLILHPYITRIVLSRYFFDLVRINPSFALEQLFPPGFFTFVSYLTSGNPQKVVHSNPSLWAMWLIWLHERFIALLFLFGWLFGLIRRQKEDWMLVFVPAGLLLMVSRLRAFDTEFHYLLPLYPAAILMSASFLASTSNRLLTRIIDTKTAFIIILGAVALLISPVLKNQLALSRPSTIDAARDWLTQNAPPGSIIVRGQETPLRIANPRDSKILPYSSLPPRVKEKVDAYVAQNPILIEENFRYDIPKPNWPDEWEQSRIDEEKKEKYVERLFKLAYLSVEEMRERNASFLVISDVELNYPNIPSWHEPGSAKDVLYKREQEAYRKALSNPHLNLVKTFSPSDSLRGRPIHIYQII